MGRGVERKGFLVNIELKTEHKCQILNANFI